MDGKVGTAANHQLLTDRDRHSTQTVLATGRLGGRPVRDRSYFGLSNKMICMYIISFVVGGIFASKGTQTDTSKGNFTGALAVGFLGFAITGLALSLMRWHYRDYQPT